MLTGDAACFAGGVLLGVALELVLHRALCALEAWLAAADVDHEWWTAMKTLDQLDETEGERS